MYLGNIVAIGASAHVMVTLVKFALRIVSYQQC